MEKQTKRPYNKIQYSNETRRANINMKKGTQQQTNSLNINLKTISKGYLLQHLKQANSQATTQIINGYIKEKGNFASTRNLFGCGEGSEKNQEHEAIRKHMLKIYSSPDFIKKIYQNEKMNMKTKLLFVKFLEKIRMAAIKPTQHKQWKQKI